jgi:DNA-binding transcriptional regulator YhcF (GntR family)
MLILANRLSDNNLEGFLFDEDEVFTKHLDEFRSLVSIRKEDGTILIHNASRISDSDRIVLYLIGAYLRHKLGMDFPEASIEEIANGLHIKPNVVAARLKELREQGLVSSTSRGISKISFLEIDSFLEKIHEKIEARRT